MERSVLMMLNSMIFSTSDPLMQSELRKHREETQQHEARLTERLKGLGVAASPTKQATAVAPTLVKGLFDQVRGDKPSKNARDGFITEHMEIATYELLERLAKRAEDGATVTVARANRADEERMAKLIAANWDRVMDLTLEVDGVRRGRRATGAKRGATSSTRSQSSSASRPRASSKRSAPTATRQSRSRRRPTSNPPST